MQQIKYRQPIFDINRVQFLHWHYWGLWNCGYAAPCDHYGMTMGDAQETSQAAIGQIDCKKRDIYVGDWLRWKSEGDIYRGRVAWRAGNDEEKFLCGYYLADIQNITDQVKVSPGEWTGEWEIIGNDVENPELASISVSTSKTGDKT